MLGRELAAFIVVGSLTVLVDFLTYRGLVDGLSFQVDIAKGCSFIVGMVFAYFVNRAWTFGRVVPASGAAWRFVLLYGISLTVNIGVNAMMLSVIGQKLQGVHLAFLLATGTSAALNFAGMKWFVFINKPVLEHQ